MSSADLLSLLEQLYLLKQFRRQGWIRAGIPITDVETVAEHTFGVAILALVLYPLENKLRRESKQLELNPERILSIALAHDLAECKFQDLDTSLAILMGIEEFKELKQRLEEKSFLQIQEELIKSLGTDVKLAKLMQQSPELQFIQELDKLDVILQALNYSKRGLASIGVHQLLTEVLDSLQEPTSFSVRKVLSEIQGVWGNKKSQTGP
ncbi:MAG: HD domain-containing protein [Candidatus Hodarchaeota archaeon]